MTKGSWISRCFWLVALLLAMQILLLLPLRPGSAESLANYSLIAAPLFALICLYLRVRHASRAALVPWFLFGAALCLWTLGMTFSVWEDHMARDTAATAFYSDLLFFLYGVPLLLVISSHNEKERLQCFLWFDGIQAVLTAYLTYITLFAVIPFTPTPIHPISEPHLMKVFNVENLALAIAASVRVLANSQRRQERAFFRVLAGFLWVYALMAGIYNYLSVVTFNRVPGMLYLLPQIPFLVLGAGLLYSPRRANGEAETRKSTSLALFLEMASPLLYPLALLSLGAVIIRSHFAIGFSAILTAVILYGIRSTLIQTRNIRTQNELHETRETLQQLSLLDGLTGIPNRRSFDQALQREWQRAHRCNDCLSLLLIDVDHFKHLNDTYGHRRGDLCLIEIARALQKNLPREEDFAARYGGEEFIVLLPGTDVGEAVLVAEKLREAVMLLRIPNKMNPDGVISISIGVAECSGTLAVPAFALLEEADQALYRAKRSGRNRVEVSSFQLDKA